MWFITGNYSHDKAIELVEATRQRLGLQSVPVSGLTKVNPAKIEGATSHLVEIGLEDKANENSCVLTYYEVGKETADHKVQLTNQVLMQYLNEPFFNDLRTKQQLGYVVFSRAVSTRDVAGC